MCKYMIVCILIQHICQFKYYQPIFPMIFVGNNFFWKTFPNDWFIKMIFNWIKNNLQVERVSLYFCCYIITFYGKENPGTKHSYTSVFIKSIISGFLLLQLLIIQYCYFISL
jgi:hypothetical protein